MPDTIRTNSALLALAPNNTTGDISAQDLRDMIVSFYNRLDDSVAIKTASSNVFSYNGDITLTVHTTNVSGHGYLNVTNSDGAGVNIAANASTSSIRSGTQLYIGHEQDVSGDVIITGGDSSSAGGGGVQILGGTSVAPYGTYGAGSSITITAGNPAPPDTDTYLGGGAGGNVSITAGFASGLSADVGGGIFLSAGQGSDGNGGSGGSSGGNIIIQGGSASSASCTGGNITIAGGSTNGEAYLGGTLTLYGASTGGDNGSISLTGGAPGTSITLDLLGITLFGQINVPFSSETGLSTIVNSFAVYDSGNLVGYVPVYEL